MSAVFRREFRAFFTNPVGYGVLAVLFSVSGYFFYLYNLYSGTADLTAVYSGLFTLTLLAAPFLTMRLFSEEKRQKTDQALLTAPVSLTGIVVGKFLAALALFAIGVSITLLYAVIIATQATPDWLVIIGNYIGLLLVGGLILSIGVLISSLTESQIIAAIGTLAVSVLLMSIDILSTLFASFSFVTAIVEFLSISSRYGDFTSGLIQYDNVVFFLTAQALFVFLTVRVLDSKRWN
ncbi:MAG: ABC transporter permease subunit [Clostridia bacterium]|nr:ABC transporter permease subunit [Clostridia bacterium]